MSVLVLLSGGIDSVTLAAMAKQRGILCGCLFYDWGQPAAQAEGLAVDRWCQRNGVALVSWRLNLDARAMVRGTGPRVVRGRNLAFIAAALQAAHDSEANEIWYGATLDDAADYPDCRSEWIDSLNLLLSLSGEPMTVSAPFVAKTKAEVVEIARGLEIDLSLTWSCYAPAGDFHPVPCGECNSCLARAELWIDRARALGL